MLQQAGSAEADLVSVCIVRVPAPLREPAGVFLPQLRTHLKLVISVEPLVVRSSATKMRNGATSSRFQEADRA